jgi:methyl acetate hydrolase
VRPAPSDRPLRWDVGGCADGEPKLRPPKRDVTTRMLLHTAGFGCDFCNEKYNRLAQEHGQSSVITSSEASIDTPLPFDPGDDWEYRSNIDWAGQVGKELPERGWASSCRSRFSHRSA